MNRHVTYGVQEKHCKMVEMVLLWALAHTLEESFTPIVAAAWGATYALLSVVIRMACSEQSAAFAAQSNLLLYSQSELTHLLYASGFEQSRAHTAPHLVHDWLYIERRRLG